MTEQEWRRVLELYETASDLPRSMAQALIDSSNEDPAVVHRAGQILGVTPASQASAKTGEPRRFTNSVIGRYDVIDLLGRGGNGEVYAGRDRDLGRLVALKIISADYASTGSSARQFLHEAHAASALNHPNIVTVLEVVTWNSSPVIVMELVDGKPLRSLCGSALTAPAAIRIGGQVLEALSFAHANGIVHRDLKPENIMVRPDGYVKVLDFGLARHMAGKVSSTPGLPVGTLRYMSPEQCRGESATQASDVFAAGIVLYEMLAARHPFHADSPLDTAHAIAWLDPRPLKQVNPEVPEEIDGLVMRMLAKDVGARPSAQEAAKLLMTSADRSALKPAPSGYWLYAALAAVLLIALSTFWFEKWSVAERTASGPQQSDFTIAPLASLLGVERMPDVTPDGARVAFEFTSENSPVGHIYLKDLVTSKLTQVTSDGAPDFEPIFSPDGSRLAFFRHAKGKLQLMLMRSEGGIERKLAELPDRGLQLRTMSWDGDGVNLIVSERLDEMEPRLALFAITVASGLKRQITFPRAKEIDCMPVVAPDGRSLGFARLDQGGSGRLWAMPLRAALTGSGESQKQLTDSDEPIRSWNWSQDGNGLLVSLEKRGRTNLWSYPLSNILGPKAPVRIEGIDDEVAQMSVSRPANHLVYARPATQNIGIWKYSIPASTQAPIRIIASAKADVDPSFSPDGKNIAFASARANPGQVDLWVSAADGSNQRQITSFGGRDPYSTGSPTWSPDGRWIAFDASPGHPSSIHVVDVLGGKPRPITDPVFWAGVPSWSSDGHWIYFCSERRGLRNIWKLPALGGAPVQVTHNGGFESFESPDGRTLYYTKYARKSGIWRMPLPDDKEELVPGLEGVSDRNWMGSPKGIYFVSSSPQQPALELYNFASGAVSRIRNLSRPPISTYRGLAVAPDGHSMLYVQLEPGRANIMVVNNFH